MEQISKRKSFSLFDFGLNGVFQAARKSLSLFDFGLNGVFQATLSVNGIPLNFSCFGLDTDGKLSDERYMTFFNQPESPCGGVKLCQLPGGAAAEFSFNLKQFPASIERIVIPATIDGDGAMSQLRSGYLSLMDDGIEFNRISFQGSDFANEKTAILAEIYRKDVRWPVGRDWQFRAISQGFSGGLHALVQHFGGSIAESALSESVPDAAAADARPSDGIPPEMVDFLGLSIGTHTDAYLRQLALFAAQHTQVQRTADRLEAMLEQVQGIRWV